MVLYFKMTIYDIFFFIFSIIYLPYLAIKGKAHKDFTERFGNLPPSFNGIAGSRPLWIHAVSVGEVIAVKNFVEAFSGRFPERRIVLSTTTRTGNEVAKKILNRDILKFYFPLDFSFVIKRVLNLINPLCFFMMETEIWPNFILESSRRNIPVALINGRISDRSYGGYRKIKFLFGGILKKISLFCMQTSRDAERIIALGAPPSGVRVTGNMKFDDGIKWGQRPFNLNGRCPHLILSSPSAPSLIIAGSTHKGEEEIVLKAYKKLLVNFPGLRLLIAPRHVDRTESIKKLIEQAGLDCILLSECKEGMQAPLAEKAIFILDTHGELNSLYNLATIVFMGGSLARRGGHNIVEPARFGKPIVFGPHMFNFRSMTKLFLENSAAIQIRDGSELYGALRILLDNKGMRDSIGRSAKGLIDKNKGATARNIREVEKILH